MNDPVLPHHHSRPGWEFSLRLSLAPQGEVPHLFSLHARTFPRSLKESPTLVEKPAWHFKSSAKPNSWSGLQSVSPEGFARLKTPGF